MCPRAIEYSAVTVITVYDPIVHSKAPRQSESTIRTRCAGHRTGSTTGMCYCDRPAVITGGELSLDMLDLTYNPNGPDLSGAACS